MIGTNATAAPEMVVEDFKEIRAQNSSTGVASATDSCCARPRTAGNF